MGRGSVNDHKGPSALSRLRGEGGSGGGGTPIGSGAPVFDLANPDQIVEKDRGIEYRWNVGEPAEDGTQQVAMLSVSHHRAGPRRYYTDTNSPAVLVARLFSEEISPGYQDGFSFVKISMSDPRNETLLKAPADRFSKKELAAFAEEARARLTGNENVFRALEDLDPDATITPEIRVNGGPDLGGPPEPPPERDPNDRTYSQPNQQFRGPAYDYLRESDKLPTYDEIAEDDDPLCKVKLFSPSGRYTYYVAAATNYDGVDSPVLTGYCLSPLGPDADEWGDQDIGSISESSPGPFGLPIERDIHFKPMRLSEIMKAKEEGRL